MSAFRDNAGKRFGRLVAVKPTGNRCGNGNVEWLCVCDCGRSVNVNNNNLNSRSTRKGTESCGCLLDEKIHTMNQTHGHTSSRKRSPTYTSWYAMFDRLRCKNYHGYARYTGIAICERWKQFENFLADMGERPIGRTLDRYPDPAGNYEPGNCRWATPKEQANNRRKRGTICVAQ